MENLLIWLIPLPPLLAFAVISLFTYRKRALSHWLAIGGAGLSWLASMLVFILAVSKENLAENPLGSSIDWLPVGDTFLKIGVTVDPLAAVTLFFVAWTVLMIFIYSVGYHNFGQPEGRHDLPGLPPHGAEVYEKAEKGRENKHKGPHHVVPSVEPMYSRFFAMIGLFAFAMFLLVLSDNLLTLYVGWEIMGLCSYLLIGFWYGKESARKAMIKAFLTTRVGDMFLLIGLVALYKLTGTLQYTGALSQASLSMLSTAISPVFGLSWAGLIGLLLFIGVIGKSAQFPLHVWLPDAMEGPTPVSAMIHAAAMVSAGIYLALRFFPLVTAGWTPGDPLTPTLTVMALIGSFTALFAATIAVAQNDVKRVLAFSTISQLGYMIAALGVGAYVAAAFHLVTHAFFKALLFLGSGSVIHGMEHGVLHTREHVDPQDMLNMGGLRKKMPLTFWTFLIGGFALSGFPLITAGFWSKDEILSGAFNGGYLAVFITLALAALLTAFYTMRQITLTFLGEPRTKAAEHAHESKATMTGPLVVLSVFAVSAGWVGIPKAFPLLGKLSANWFEEFVGSMVHFEHAGEGHHSLIPLFTSLGVALGGLLIGWLTYRKLKAGSPDPLVKALGPLHTLLKNKYYIDEFYHLVFIRPARWIADVAVNFIDLKIIDGAIHAVGRFALWFGRILRQFVDIPVVNGAGDGLAQGTRGAGTSLKVVQTGRVQQYMVIALSALILVAIIFILVVA